MHKRRFWGNFGVGLLQKRVYYTQLLTDIDLF